MSVTTPVSARLSLKPALDQKAGNAAVGDLQQRARAVAAERRTKYAAESATRALRTSSAKSARRYQGVDHCDRI